VDLNEAYILCHTPIICTMSSSWEQLLTLNKAYVKQGLYRVIKKELCKKSTIFWVVMLCSSVEVHWCFSKISVDFYRTTWRYNSENHTLHNHCCEDLKSNKNFLVLRLYILLNLRHIITEVVKCSETFSLFSHILVPKAKIYLQLFYSSVGLHLIESYALNARCLNISEPTAWPPCS
jgi:hypothetical protein